MTRSTYFILAALMDGRRHGYGIIEDVRRLSDEDVRLSAGTLYGALDRLLKAGSIADDGAEIVDGRARRYYTLTSAGRAAVNAEAGRLARAGRVVLARPDRVA